MLGLGAAGLDMQSILDVPVPRVLNKNGPITAFGENVCWRLLASGWVW